MPLAMRPVNHNQGTQYLPKTCKYSVADAPEVKNFLNQDSRGKWGLTVSDHANRDIGKLNQWALRIV